VVQVPAGVAEPRKLLVACVFAFLALATAPQYAGAATLSHNGSQATYNAAPGEPNELDIETGTDQVGPFVRFTDVVPITGTFDGTNNCGYTFQGSQNSVTCDYVPNTTINLGDGNDRLGTATASDYVAETNDTVDGGTGNDKLNGFQGNDALNGGPGDDSLEGEMNHGRAFWRIGSDVLNGGDGNDLVSYYLNDAGVQVSLNNVADDGAGEGDNVIAVELVRGGGGNDVLIGDGLANHLDGSSGSDEIRGGGGNDVVLGDAQNDRLFGEDGDDEVNGQSDDDLVDGGRGTDRLRGDGDCTIFSCQGGFDQLMARDGFADSVDCGIGGDRATVDRIDTTTADCEDIDVATDGVIDGGASGLSFRLLRQRLLRALARGYRISFGCRRPCRVRGTFQVDSGLLARRVTVARGSKTLRRAGRATLVLRFTARAKRRLRRRRVVKGIVRVRAAPLGGGRVTTRRRAVTLRR
jgi:RTX calcium-binding nonapeptide repeat (4 copies)